MKNGTKRVSDGGWGKLSAADRKSRIERMLQNRAARRAERAAVAVENELRQRSAKHFSIAVPNFVEPAQIIRERDREDDLDYDTIAKLIIAVARRMR